MNENEKQCWIEIVAAINKYLIAEEKGLRPVSDIVAEKKREEQKQLNQIPAAIDQALKTHKWKGRKLGPDSEGKMQYESGSPTWGWDWEKNFTEEILAGLREGPVESDGLKYTFDQEMHTVSKRKAE